VVRAREQIKVAEQEDREAHATAVTRNPDTPLKPRRADSARRSLADAELRFEALATAVERAASALYERSSEEAPRVIEAARRTRARDAEAITEAIALIERSLDSTEQALSLAKWVSGPNVRWKVALRTLHAGRGSRNVGLDVALEAVAALPELLRSQPLPGEEQPEREVKFGLGGGTRTGIRSASWR
jgi:hypothetical protein